MQGSVPLSTPEQNARLLGRLRWLTGLFVLGLMASGATAIPLESGMRWLEQLLRATPEVSSSLLRWVARVSGAVSDTSARYPFMAYGTDWLAFGHFIIALFFIQAWRKPVQNRWLFDFGLVACALVIPYALIMGQVREIPLGWRLIDCSFGVLGAIPLWLCRKMAQRLADARCAVGPASATDPSRD